MMIVSRSHHYKLLGYREEAMTGVAFSLRRQIDLRYRLSTQIDKMNDAKNDELKGRMRLRVHGVHKWAQGPFLTLSPTSANEVLDAY